MSTRPSLATALFDAGGLGGDHRRLGVRRSIAAQVQVQCHQHTHPGLLLRLALEQLGVHRQLSLKYPQVRLEFHKWPKAETVLHLLLWKYRLRMRTFVELERIIWRTSKVFVFATRTIRCWPPSPRQHLALSRSLHFRSSGWRCRQTIRHYNVDVA
jgi:hypothetical protein